MDHKALSGAKMTELSIVKIRADGSEEHIRTVRTYKNPIKQLCWNFSQWVRQHLFYKGN